MKKSNDERRNVIDLAERRRDFTPTVDPPATSLRLRLDMEQAKIAISTSLISIVVVVTFANSSIWSTGPTPAIASAAESPATQSRGIASLPGKPSGLEEAFVRTLAAHDLMPGASVGRRPSSLDRLTLGFLEGKYAVRLDQGKLSSLEFNGQSASGDAPKFVDRVRFLEQNRELLPVAFDRLAKVSGAGASGLEVYDLLRLGSDVDVSAAKVEFRMDGTGRLLSMKVHVPHVAFN